MSHELPAQPNNSLIHGLECLQAVVAAGGPIGSRELARQLDMEPTRVNRLLKTLAHLELLKRTDARKYIPGAGVHTLAALSLQGSHLLPAAMPHARAWWEQGYSLTLGVLWRQYLCFLLSAKPELPFDRSIGAHDVLLAPYSSAGLVLLAHQPPRIVRQWKFPQLERLVEPVAELPAQLAEARKTGYGVRHYRDGVISIGVPIGSPPIAAFAVSKPGLTKREVVGIVGQLQETVRKILADDQASSAKTPPGNQINFPTHLVGSKPARAKLPRVT